MARPFDSYGAPPTAYRLLEVAVTHYRLPFTPQSSLVIQTSFLGDVVLTTPLLAELARRGPVDIITTPAAAPLLANHPAIRDVIIYDKRQRDSGPIGFWRMVRRIRAGAYTDAYLAQGSSRSGLLAAVAGVKRRVGFDTSAGRFWYTERSRHIRDQHHAERLWRLAVGNDVASAASEATRPRLYPGDAEHAAVDALIRDVPRDGARMLALAPGSIWGTKRWPYFPALAKRLSPVYRLVVVGAASDGPLADAIATAAGPERVVDATGRLSLLASAELIGRCAAIVTNDSAPLHLASAVGTPTVALFGPTIPAFGFGPLAPRHAIAEVSGLPCRPCDSHGPMLCPLGHFKCMMDLDAQRVFDAVVSVAAA